MTRWVIGDSGLDHDLGDRYQIGNRYTPKLGHPFSVTCNAVNATMPEIPLISAGLFCSILSYMTVARIYGSDIHFGSFPIQIPTERTERSSRFVALCKLAVLQKPDTLVLE